MTRLLPQIICVAVALGACTEEPPARTVTEFVENPNLLEAAMVRCSLDRNSTRYDAECVNAREAVKRMEAKEEAARRVELEKQSEQKRRALRRTQEAAAAARRRAAFAAQQRREEEYLAQFGVPMPVDGNVEQEEDVGNSPLAVIPEPERELPSATAEYQEAPPAGTNANAPTVEAEPQEPQSDLAAIRDELKRREDGEGN